MTPALRKYHRVFWLGMAAILPVFYLAAIFAIPEPIPDTSAHNTGPEELPIVIRTKATQIFDLAVRADTVSQSFQLEVIVRKPLTYPEAVIYVSFDPSLKVSKRILVGRLSSLGVHRFALGDSGVNGTYEIEIMDPIKNRIIEHTEL